MKSEQQISNEITYYEGKLIEKQSEHVNLDQISMLSKEGSDLRADINEIKGIIKTLKWVLI